MAADELLETLTTAPPGGACPFSMIVPPAYAPPLIVVGVTLTSFSDDGMSVNWPVAEAPLRVAVSVTAVGVDFAGEHLELRPARLALYRQRHGTGAAAGWSWRG